MSAAAQQVMLAHSWTVDSDIDPTGHWMSEKLDGVRAYFDGKDFYSRAGNKFMAPDWFKDNLPKDQPLDGELWLGRGLFQKCISIVKNQKVARADEWKGMTYLVFDVPQMDKVYEKRIEYLKSIMPIYGKDSIGDDSTTTSTTTTPTPTGNGNGNKIPPFARMVPVQRCLSKSHLLKELKHVQSHGGEGIMLRTPRSRYEFKRSRTLLKVKTFFDEEAIVLKQVQGSGKNSSKMGHLEVETPDGRRFSVGSGFTDAQRDKPPKVGSIITYKFQELSTTKLTPRFPTFIGVRIDVDWQKYCRDYEPPTLKQATSSKVVGLLKQKSLIFQDGDDVDVDDSGDVNGTVDDEVSEGEDSDSSASACSSTASGTNNKRKRTLPNTVGNTSSKSKSATPTSTTAATPSSSSSPSAPVTPSAPTKQDCRFGAACYRKNPDHLREFSHPHKRTRVQ